MTVRAVVLGLVVRTDREAHIPRHTLHTGVRVCRQTLMDERINNTVKQVRVSLRCAQDITGLTVVGAGFNDEAGRQLNLFPRDFGVGSVANVIQRQNMGGSEAVFTPSDLTLIIRTEAGYNIETIGVTAGEVGAPFECILLNWPTLPYTGRCLVRRLREAAHVDVSAFWYLNMKTAGSSNPAD